MNPSPNPDARPDLDGEAPIAELVRAFYARVQQDDLLAPVFVDQAQVDWDEHLPNITAFWMKLEHKVPGFSGVPTATHRRLAAAVPFRAEQFGRWVELFHDTIDAGWAGPHAESIKARAVHIARAQSRVVEGAEPWGED